VDTSVPSVARIYDYAVGGKDNFEVDRIATRDMVDGAPEMVRVARENRAFLGRAVDFLAEEAGVRQFIDNGSGLPTARNVHQVAQEANSDARVVYVDNDPAVLAYGRALLAENGNTTVLQADMAAPEEILQAPRTRELIDFDQPVAVLYVSVLHCLPDEAGPGDAVRRLLDAVPSCSYLLLSHIVSDDRQAADYLTEFMTSRSSWGRVRTPEEASRYFDGLELVEPGLVDVAEWRADADAIAFDSHFQDAGDRPVEDKKLWELGGIGRKP
jgi:hypothetical protein